MPLTTTELYDDLDATANLREAKASAERAYLIEGSSDEVAVIAEAEAEIPATYLGLPLVSVALDERIGNDKWRVIARYESTKVDVGGGGEKSSFSFDTGGGTQTLRESISVASKYPAGADDSQGTLHDDGEHVQGIEITVPVYRFTETHYLPVADVDAAYKATLASLTGKVNSDAFKGFTAGEVLFLGASGSRRDEEEWAITYSFAVSENKTGLSVGTGSHEITGIAKLGWQYLEVVYRQATVGTRRRNVPKAVYIHNVYETAAFSGLGI